MPAKKTANRPPEASRVATRLLIIGLAVLVLLPAALILALHVPAVQRELIQFTVDRIESSTEYKIDLGFFDWSPFSRLNAADVHVQARGKQILAAERIEVNYGLTFAWPYIELEQVHLEKPFLQLEKGADGKWQLPRARTAEADKAKNRGTPFWLKIGLPKVRIVSGTIEARQQGNVIVSVKDVSGAIDLKAVQGPDGPMLSIDMEMLRAQLSGGQLGEWNIEGALAIRGNEFSSPGVLLTNGEGGKCEIRGAWDLSGFKTGDVDVDLTRFSLASIPALNPAPEWAMPVTGRIKLARDGGRWSLKHDVTSENGSVHGSATVEELGADGFHGDFTSEFADLMLRSYSSIPDSTLNGKLSATVRVEDRKLTGGKFALNLLDSSVGAETVYAGELTGAFGDGVLSVGSSVLRSSLADLTFSGTADLAGFWDPEHQGGLRAEITVGRASLERLGPRIPKGAGGGAVIEAAYNPGEFRKPLLWHGKTDVNIDIPEFIVMKAAASFENETIKVDYDLDARDVQRIAGFYPVWQGKGRAFSRGKVSGKWPDLLWEGDATWERFQFASVSADSITAKGRAKIADKEGRRVVSFKAHNLLFDGKKIKSLSADFDQQKTSADFKASADGISGQGSVRLSGRIDRIWDFPLLSVSTQGQLGWKDQNAKVDARFEINPDGLRIHSATLQQGRQRAVLSGGLISETHSDLRVAVDSVGIAWILGILGWKEEVSGTVSGQVQIGGRPEQPEGKLNMQGTNLLVRGKQKIDRISIEATYSRNVLAFQADAKSPVLESPLSATGRIPLRLSFKPPVFDPLENEPLGADIKVDGILAEIALPYLDFLDRLGGKIQGEIRLTGTIRQPVITGNGTWEGGFFREKRWPHLVDNIHAEWQADSNRINVTRAQASHLGGSVSATGFIEWPRFRTLDFKASGTNLRIRDIYGVEGVVSGDAQIQDNPAGAELTGNFVFSQAKMSIGGLETDIAQRIEVIDSESRGDIIEYGDSTGSEFYNRLRMNVGLQLPRAGSWVTGKGLSAEVAGGLKLQKAPGNSIRLSGEVQAMRGTYSFQGKEMRIVEGSLVFTGKPQPDPQVRILTQKQVRDITLQAVVSGPLSKPKLTMSSIPAMNQVDVLSYIMFDHAAGDLSSRESSQFQDRAAAWLGSQASTILKSAFGNSPLAPDVIKYRSTTGRTDYGFSSNPNIGSTSTERTGVVEIGKYITPNLFVTYGRGITGEETNEVQVEYRVNRYLSVQTQVGGGDQSGVDVFWRRDFGK
ncbi:MAG: translocation/assembly module TamB domain-containing protein [Desulfobacteraceae bacterium]|nr:translocation/assembly module TamB domain-containing protein [Desulfobacteraceae bacterium]